MNKSTVYIFQIKKPNDFTAYYDQKQNKKQDIVITVNQITVNYSRTQFLSRNRETYQMKQFLSWNKVCPIASLLVGSG